MERKVGKRIEKKDKSILRATLLSKENKLSPFQYEGAQYD